MVLLVIKQLHQLFKKIRDELREMMIEYNNKVKREEDKKQAFSLWEQVVNMLQKYIQKVRKMSYIKSKNISKENKIDRQYRNELIEKQQKFLVK